jgi:urate oxidase
MARENAAPFHPGDSAMPAVLVHHAYGKSRVRLTRVTRLGDRHEIRELDVDIRLEGDFAASYTHGDNSQVIATDTMKNVVYAFAHGRPAEAIEDFAAALARHFVDSHDHVRTAVVTIAEHPWHRIEVGESEHPHAFIRGGTEVRTATVTASRDGATFEAGLEGLQVLKTTRSSFAGFLRDAYTTLPEAADRIFATEVRARWTYGPRASIDWDEIFPLVRTALVTTFAEHDSRSVQQTLHAMGEAALAASEAVDEITLTMPNKHRLLVDLTRFGKENVNEVFVATDEPYGLITGTLRRT